MICEFCGYEFSDDLGRYGCPNCEGEGIMIKGRTNSASANTRAIRKALAGRVECVTVKSFDYCGGGGEVVSKEIESLMSARAILKDAGFKVSEINTFSALEPRFYVEKQGA